MRLNVIKGNLNPEKMVKLYEDVSERHEHEALQDLMGFTDQERFENLVGEVQDDMREMAQDAGMSDRAVEELEDATEEAETVDDLSAILNKMFTQYGDTLDQNYMWFSYGGEDHLYVQCDSDTWGRLQDMMDSVQEAGSDASEVFGQLLVNWQDKLDERDDEEDEEDEGGENEDTGDDESADE